MPGKGGRPRSADKRRTVGVQLLGSVIERVEYAAAEAGRDESVGQYVARLVESTFRAEGDRPASRTPRPVRNGCPHPRSKRQVTPYFSRCGACGARL